MSSPRLRFLIDQPAMTGQTLVIDGGQRFMALPRDVQFVEQTMKFDDGLSGIVPAALKVRQQRIVIDRIEVMADIGFHEFEIGMPQRLLVSIELWIDPPTPPADDDPARAWDYDVVVQAVRDAGDEPALQPPGNAGPRDFRRKSVPCTEFRRSKCRAPSPTFTPMRTALALKSRHFAARRHDRRGGRLPKVGGEAEQKALRRLFALDKKRATRR